GLDGVEIYAPLSADPEALAEARGCAAFHATLDPLRGLLHGDEVEAYGLSRTPNTQLLVYSLVEPEALAAGDSYWDDVSTEGVVETRSEQVVKAMNAAGARLQSLIGGSPDGWAWGRVHFVTPAADLFSLIGIGTYDGPTYANDGGLYTVDV